MITLQPVDEIFASWRRCVNIGVDNSASVMSSSINEEGLQNALNENKELVSIFGNLESDFEDLSLERNLVLLLVNSEGLLLKKNAAGS
ncbi:hypothetical protein [Ruminiclostridium cellobioparum]|uniref:Uncharacterized protein n=1 Tax=Ruminiclostridium cellobioparum subsp. termitidis CT1112 TaxID=1195236 RepID=S0FJQ9_RUMCE|nr:hypothetical protein [Ruminiclostridium cellobioparum]EMS70541.1 hypothetical protein CTER_3688 [Ruminiclostridium cellobioparum subsp. termitidis CT1112]